MKTSVHRIDGVRAGKCLTLALLLAAAAAGAAEPVGRVIDSMDGTAHPHATRAKPRIARIFFSPAERRSRHGGSLAAAQTGGGSSSRERHVVNGALSSNNHGRAVWVDGAAVEDSARDKSAWTDRNGNVWLMSGAQGTHLVKPGQSIDRNGVIEDLLPSGAVARR
jgi:hypothetical protein